MLFSLQDSLPVCFTCHARFLQFRAKKMSEQLYLTRE
uniref:Anthranilate synthase alpha subunit 2ic-like isoform X3 n=1 Tax=Rhizophora mucronata TaxID=61149 RepID=A0A2P2KK31_RHIMU